MKKSLICLLLVGILFISTQIAYADNDDFCSGTWSDPDDLRLQAFTSSDDFKSIISSNHEAWNSISGSNIYVDTYSWNANDTNLGYEIRVYGEDLPTAYGTCLNYTKNWLGFYVPSWTDTWEKSVIKLDTTSGSSGLGSKSSNFQKKVFIHELGHSFALDHPDHSSGDAIMHTGDNGYYDVQQHDKDNMAAKW